jgi:hypothetical protein
MERTGAADDPRRGNTGDQRLKKDRAPLGEGKPDARLRVESGERPAGESADDGFVPLPVA